jgi:tRNA nucleotidyltransferase/poly(A) polymerase
MPLPFPEPEPAAARQFAVEVVTQLQSAGYLALWAGGCVRDQLLGKRPKDYDVATNAKPEEVQAVFGKRRTQFVGASFGVVAVRGAREAGTIEVATFRRDEGYSDGRHPDRVVFSSPEEDAQRRDFTINGLFYDPIQDQIHDFVGGREDLARRVLRCIGDPAARFGEDKLRMLRAVRFATVLDFSLDPDTLAAIVRHADELTLVSPERIGIELRKILAHPSRAVGLDLLRRSRLWAVMLPEHDPPPSDAASLAWQQARDALGWLPDQATFPEALAVILHPLLVLAGRDHLPMRIAEAVERLVERWRLTNEESSLAGWLLEHAETLWYAPDEYWPRIQRLLVHPHGRRLLEVNRALLRANDESLLAPLDWCEDKLDQPAETLNPAPLVTGDDLLRLGLRPGPEVGSLLRNLRDYQLLGRLASREAALQYAQAAIASRQPDPLDRI